MRAYYRTVIEMFWDQRCTAREQAAQETDNALREENSGYVGQTAPLQQNYKLDEYLQQAKSKELVT